MPAKMPKKRKPLWTEQHAELKQQAGRVCTFPECETRLSVYNESDRCSRHQYRKIQPK